MSKTETETAPRTCQCYSQPDGNGGFVECDAEVRGKKSVFAPGHDARYKGALIKAWREGRKHKVQLANGKNRNIDPEEAAAERGWSHFLVEKTKRKSKPKPKAEPVEDMEPADLEPVEDDGPALTELATESGVAKIGRASYQVDILSKSKDGSKFEIQYTTKKGDAKTTTIAADKVEIGASLQ